VSYLIAKEITIKEEWDTADNINLSKNTNAFDNQDFIRQLKAGDESAFKDLVLNYQNKVFNVCLGLLKNEEEAEDISQEVFIEVYQKISQFNAESKLSTWIYRIAINKSLEQIRFHKRQKRFAWLTSLFGMEDKFAERQSEFYHPGVALENKERSRVLFKAIDQLVENQRTAFIMHKLEGLSYAEIAEIMQLSIPSVESLLHRAKKKLQQLLHNFYQQDQ
jgi:RNA polymerase sigma factor (sigma-70 family)